MRKCVCSRAFLMSFFCTVLVLLFVFGMLVSAGLGEHTVPLRIHNPRELILIEMKA